MTDLRTEVAIAIDTADRYDGMSQLLRADAAIATVRKRLLESADLIARAIFAATSGGGTYLEREYQDERERHIEIAEAAIRAAVGVMP